MSAFVGRIAPEGAYPLERPGRRPRGRAALRPVETPSLDAASCRRVMSYWATGVSVVTSQAADGPRGCTVNSFTSLSLDPLLLLVALHRDSGTLSALRACGGFCINVLASHQDHLSRRFARPSSDADKFRGVEYAVVDGAPVLAGCLATISCRTEHTLAGGDHEIVVARPIAAQTREDASALVFYRRGYQPAEYARAP
jgi:3-hydroxy-9,10-secoandrosta-1,3,5(10)-triene-9,17-dione monooxygenase reductase component